MIIKLKKGEFIQIGSLQMERYGHGIIYDGRYIMVFGGVLSAAELTRETEKCTIVDNRIECSTQKPNLDRFTTYPELFLVEPYFCDNPK